MSFINTDTSVNPSLQLIRQNIYLDDLTSPDPYDVWNLKIGQVIKKIYYKNRLLGIIPAAALTLFDFYLNNSLRIGYRQRVYPIAHSLKALTSLILYAKTRENEYLQLAEKSLEWLSQNYSRNYSGYCWGINMPWVSKIATYDEEVPHITHTPYALEAFVNYQKESKTVKYNKIIDSVLNFIEEDLSKIIDTKDTLALSYSPRTESRIVVNANSYAMFCYALLKERTPNLSNHIEDKIKRLYNFISSQQNDDGSWYYFADRKKGNFIDCFHSCFILKNIYKVNQITPLPGSNYILDKGFQYLKDHFWDDSKYLFTRFSKTDRMSLVKYDLYDNAEMLNLAILLNQNDLIEILSNSIKENFIVNTDIYSNIIYPNVRINKNTLRWASFPYLYALSKTI